MRNADEGRIGIKLPPLNAALVEVHRELATVQNGAKDMVTKTKHLKKQEKDAQGQLDEAQRRILELEEQLRAQPIVEYKCIMDVFTLSPWTAQVRAIYVNSIKGQLP